MLGKLTEAAQEAMREGRHRVVEVEGERSLIEVVGSPSRLLVCGAGHDADPVVRYGTELGFETVVTDDRRHLLTAERFPEGTELVHAEARELSSVIPLDERTYVVLMSHNYLRDLEYLRQLHGAPVAYIGALGPSERLDRLFDRRLHLKRVESTPRPIVDRHRAVSQEEKQQVADSATGDD